MTATQLTIAPSSPLAPFVSWIAYYAGDHAHGLERVVPNGSMQLMVNLHEDEFRLYDGADLGTVRTFPGAVVEGASARPSVIDTSQQRELAMVVFRNGGGSPFFSSLPELASDELVDLGEVWGRSGAVLRDQLLETPSVEGKLRALEAALIASVRRPLVRDGSVDLALKAFEHGTSVAAVTEQLGMTSKRFIRTFTEQVGLSPKRYSRVRRFQRMLASIPYDRPVDWAELAAARGYYDQSHLIHEFRDLAGVLPTAYRPRSRGEQNHIPVS